MADFYGTATGFKTYESDRGRPADAGVTDAEIDAALLVASEWLDGVYRSSFAGLKVGGRDQIREWPRTGVVDMYGYAVSSDGVPREVENATYEATFRQIANPGSLIIDYTPGKYKKAAVSGAVSVEYASFGYASDAQPQYLVIDQILAPLLLAVGAGDYSGLSGKLVRA